MGRTVADASLSPESSVSIRKCRNSASREVTVITDHPHKHQLEMKHNKSKPPKLK